MSYDPEHRLVLTVCPGKRSKEKIRQVIQETKQRTGGRIMRLLTSDEYKPYLSEIIDAYGVSEVVKPTAKPGRPRNPCKKAPPGLLYATIHKTRENGIVVKVLQLRQYSMRIPCFLLLQPCPQNSLTIFGH